MERIIFISLRWTKGSSSVVFYSPSLEIRTVWSSEGCQHPTLFMPLLNFPHSWMKGVWALLFGQTTSQSKNKLTPIESGPCSECCQPPWMPCMQVGGELRGVSSPLPAWGDRRHCYQQWDIVDKRLLPLLYPRTCTKMFKHLKTGKIGKFCSRTMRESSSLCIKESGENIRQKTIILSWAPFPVLV